MSKLLQFFSFLALGFVAVGSAMMPNNLIFWFTSAAPLYQGVRIGLAIILVLQLITNPPRHPVFRFVTGVIATGVGVWVLQQSYLYHMPLLDALSMLAACITILVTALERKVAVDDIVSTVTNRRHAKLVN